MNVFVSSTCYDLIDVRAEISELITKLGASPVMSDDSLSAFDASHSANSIETCLINVDQCDVFVMILDQRYGPSLAKAGFDDVSATHLEYNRAVEKGKPIHVFARDRLLGDFRLWKTNKSARDIKLSWLGGEKDRGLLTLLDAHQKLDADADSTNWVTPFTSTVDLKASLTSRLQGQLLEPLLLDRISRNEFPLLEGRGKHRLSTGDRLIVADVDWIFRNAGRSPAFSVSITVEGEEEPTLAPILAPGSAMVARSVCLSGRRSKHEHTALFDTHYESAIGVSITERYEMTARLESYSPPTVYTFVTLLSRNYSACDPVSITLEES